MLWMVTADLVTAIHAAYVAFVVIGFVAILAGWPAGWDWVRNFYSRVDEVPLRRGRGRIRGGIARRTAKEIDLRGASPFGAKIQLPLGSDKRAGDGKGVSPRCRMPRVRPGCVPVARFGTPHARFPR